MRSRDAALGQDYLTMIWQLWRQDDNGHRFLVGEYEDRTTAEVRMAELMTCHNKQTYWVEKGAE